MSVRPHIWPDPWGRDLVIPVIIYGVAAVTAYAAGFSMRIPWEYWQLLDASVLAAHPIGSLCFLHSQPPVLNAMTGAVLAIATALGVASEHVAMAVFGLLGVVAAVVLYRCTRVLTGSAVVAAIGLAVVVADPAYHVLGTVFFYEFVLHVWLVLLLAATLRYLDGGTTAQLLSVTLLLVTISLTRTLFHPMWAVGFWGLVVCLRAGIVPPPRAVVAGMFVVLVLLLSAWPAKNALVYGQFRYATMSAFSLTRSVPNCSGGALLPYMPAEQPTGPEIVARATRICGPAGVDALSAPVSNRTGNWNSPAQLLLAPARERCAFTWMRHEPREWLRRTAGQYAMWMRPAFVHTHGQYDLGPDSAAVTSYLELWKRTLFADLRPLAERVWPTCFLHEYAMLDGYRPVPYTAYGFVLFPLLCVALVVRGFRRRATVDGAIAWVLLAMIVCPMMAACLTDGLEGNRMRFASSPLVVVAACVILHPRRSYGASGTCETSHPPPRAWISRTLASIRRPWMSA